MAVIGIIDYGMGNLRSVQKGLQKVGASTVMLDGPDGMDGCDGLVLPGVGAFGDAMRNLDERGFATRLLNLIADGKPLLGICLGMQLLFDYSDEHGRFEGLGVVPGGVLRLPPEVKVPHMGWNVLEKRDNPALFDGISEDTRFYFVHSYYCAPSEPGWTVGSTPYGLDFTSAVGRGSLYGVQFHPEKSSTLGLKVLKNFDALAGGR